MNKFDLSFWAEMKQLIATQRIVIDRPKGQSHPRHPEMIYPLDYGYIEGTTSSDGGGIDVWIGTQNKTLTGILCTFDTLKQDMEIKILLGCNNTDLQSIKDFYGHEMKILFLPSELQ